MVASARFCSSPVSVTAAQETLKRFQYESIQTLVPLSLSLSPSVFLLPFFPTTTFSIASFAPIPRSNFFPSYPFLFFILPFSFTVSTSTKFSRFFRVTGPGSKKPGRISSLTESLSRDDYLFVSLSVMHGRDLVFAYIDRPKSGNNRYSLAQSRETSTVDSEATLRQMTVRLSSSFRFSSFEGAKSPTSAALSVASHQGVIVKPLSTPPSVVVVK